MSLRERAASGVKWTGISAMVGAISQLLLVAILAHLLGKADFGLMAIAMFIIGFSQLFIDMGISNAIIYKQEVTDEQLDSLYWLNIISGLLIFGILFLLAPLVADFYDEPKLVSVVRWIAATFIIQPFGMQYAVLLQKRLEFRSLAVRDIMGKLVSFIVGCIMGWQGYGVYALIFSSLLGALAGTVALLVVGLKFHRPRFYFNYREVKPFVSFGLYQMGENIINYFNSQIDSVIIGKFLGMEILGVYNVAKNLVMRPAQIINPIITKVSFPVMASVQNDNNKLKQIYLKSLEMMSSVNFPVFIFMCFFAEPIVLIMFGKAWVDGILALRILAVYSLLRSTVNPVGTLQMAKGRADIGFYWNAALLALVPLAIYIGSFWGINGVCTAFVIQQMLISVPVWRYFVRPLCEATLTEYYNSFVPPLWISTLSVLVAFICCYSWIGYSLPALMAGLAISCMLFMLLTWFFHASLLQELKFMIKAKTSS